MPAYTETQLNALYHELQKEGIEGDIVVFDDISIVPAFDFTYHLDRVVITLCTGGSIRGFYDLRDIRFRKGDLVALLPDHLISLSEVSPDYKGIHIMMSKNFAFPLRQSNSLTAQLHFHQQPVLTLDGDEFQAVADCINLLRYIIRLRSDRRHEMAASLFNLLFHLALHFRNFSQRSALPKTRQEEIFERFHEAIVRHHRTSREVVFYADKLCLTPKYLSAIVKQLTGASANSWIDRYVITESKAALRTEKQLTIQDIADRMGFVDQATFSKYFKKHTGKTPTDYRNG